MKSFFASKKRNRTYRTDYRYSSRITSKARKSGKHGHMCRLFHTRHHRRSRSSPCRRCAVHPSGNTRFCNRRTYFRFYRKRIQAQRRIGTPGKIYPGFFAMIGALVFLGCPWRAILRLAGGDLNAIVGIAGLTLGIYIGILFIKSGYNLGRSQKTYVSVGLIIPAIMIILFIVLLIKPELKTGALFLSVKGPGAMAAPVFISLAAGLIIGILAQKTRFCTMGSIRDVILVKDFHLLSGVIALFIGAIIVNIILKQFNPGFEGQPVAHTDHLWNFLGMVLSGLAFALAGGCPGRQLFMSGEGDSDAAVFVCGMVFGAAIAHNFTAASSPKGTGELGPLFVIIGLMTCLMIGFTMRKKL